MIHKLLNLLYRIFYAFGNLWRIEPAQRLRGHYYNYLLGPLRTKSKGEFRSAHSQSISGFHW